MTNEQLRDRALEIARTTPGNLLENAENIYNWLIQDRAKAAIPVQGVVQTGSSIVPADNVVSSQGQRVVGSVVSGLVKGPNIVR